jgi:hypothetical protein
MEKKLNNNIFANKKMQISEDFKNYLAGFFDGDGSITVERQTKDEKVTGYSLRIKFSQSNEDFINTIKRYYNFLKKTKGDMRKETHRVEYELRAAGIQIKPLVEDLLKYSILKYSQLLEAMKFFELINKLNKNNEKQEIYEKLKELKQIKDIKDHEKLNTNNINKPYNRCNIKYIAGLFDAEGCIKLNEALTISITQQSDIIILKTIAEMYENVKLDDCYMYLHGRNSEKLLRDIKPYCIYKLPQINAALTFIETIGEPITEEIKEIRNNCREIIANEKKVDINLKNLQFKNQESHKLYLRECFKTFEKFDYDKLLIHCKKLDISKIKKEQKFEDKIFNRETWEDFNIKPVLEFCETDKQHKLYKYYREKVSSLPSRPIVGKCIRLLVKDSISEMYIGIMCLSSDIYCLGDRDKYIGWDTETKREKLNNVLNLSCCVPLQPFGFNTAGGKLLASLAFSKEIFEYHLKKYKQPLLGIITTSINGKSIQYDRLKCLKMIGYTKGFGSVNVPDELYYICKEYNNTWKVFTNSELNKETNNLKKGRVGRFEFLKSIIKHLNLKQLLLKHDKKRGIYFGYLFSSKLNYEYNINELKSVDEIYLAWKKRWCDNRIQNLIKKDNIKTTLDLYTNEFFEKFKDIKFILPKISEKIFTDNLIKHVLTFKSKNISKPNMQ